MAEASPLTEEFLIEAISWVASEAVLPIPKPVIRPAVRMVVNAASEFDFDDVARVLQQLGLGQLAGRVFQVFSDKVGEADDVPCEVECPESEDIISFDDGDGTYTCPDCDQDIEVAEGTATHAFEVECPVVDSTVWVGPEEATYKCPECAGEIVVEDGEADHAYAEVRCPRSGDTIALTEGDGTYPCPDCGAQIVLEGDEAEHEAMKVPAVRRNRAPRRSRAR